MGSPAATIAEQASLGDALFSPVQQRLLALLFGQPERRFQSAEIIRLADSGSGAVQRQLTRLASAGWIKTESVGNQKHYQANTDCPAYADLQALVVKTFGVAEPIRRALAGLASDIHAACIYGSVAKRTDRAVSDVDLLVISDTVTYPDLVEAVQRAEATLARPINPTLMSRAEWRRKRAKADSFASRIAAQPRIFILGNERDLG